jgi:hypothetical protein
MVGWSSSDPKGEACVCGADGGAVAAVAAISPTMPAGAAVNFSGVATADAARVTVVVPNAPATSSIVDTGITSAQAVVTSAGTSKAYGSNPYPGENAVTIHGTLAGFGVAGVPAYPLYAESVHPSAPKTEIGQGPFYMGASSTATSSEGTAKSGVAGEQNALLTSALASVRQGDDGGVASKAESKVQGFAAGPLKIASIVSLAEANLPGSGGALQKASSLEVTGFSVNDVAVQLTPQGLKVKDQTVPADGKALEEALAKANVKLTYIAPEELPNGIVGAGLRVSTQFTIPGNAPSDVVWLFGRALAVIDAAPGESLLPGVGEVGVTDPGSSAGPPPGTEPTVTPTEPPPVDVAASSGALSSDIGASPLRNGFASLPAGPAPETSSVVTTGSEELAAPPETAPPPAEAASPSAPPATARPASVSKGDDSGLYLLLVAGAAAIFVLAQVLGAVGVRSK